MDTNDYKATLNCYAKELAKAIKQRAALDKHIVALAQAIEGLKLLSAEEDDHYELTGFVHLSGGLADAIRSILQSSQVAATPVTLRNYLVGAKFDLSRYPNPLAAIHGVLGRMKDAGQVEPIESEDGKTAFKWINPISKRIDEVLANPAIHSNVKADLIQGLILQNRKKK